MAVDASVNINRLNDSGCNDFSQFDADLYSPDVFAFDLSVCVVWACANPSDVLFIRALITSYIRSLDCEATL